MIPPGDGSIPIMMGTAARAVRRLRKSPWRGRSEPFGDAGFSEGGTEGVDQCQQGSDSDEQVAGGLGDRDGLPFFDDCVP